MNAPDKLPGDPSRSPLLAYLLPFAVAVAGGFFGWITGVQPKLDGHTREIEQLKIEQRQHGTQLERIESKLDRWMERHR